MNENILYRKVEINEIDQYHEIRLHCLQNYPQNFGTLYDEEKNSSNFKFDKIISQHLVPDFLMGAFSKGSLVGICGYIQEKREKTKHIGEISGMYVKPEFSGQKIGAGLLEKTIQIAFDNSDLEQIILAVAGKNQTAQNLYRKFGFKEYGRLHNYFKIDRNYETQIFMSLIREEKQTTNR